MTIGQAFNASVKYYDDWIRKALPGYEDLFRTALEIIPFSPEASLAVLDLGAGTGLFSHHVLKKFPRARVVLCDVAEKMLDLARERFRERGEQIEFTVKDYRSMEGPETYDLVVSSMSLHHLSDLEKQVLFGRIYGLLRQPGVFVNVDQVKGETPYLEDLYWSWWLQRVREAGADEEQIRAGIERRLAYDQDSSMTDQLTWLKEAGFETADCVYKYYSQGVFFALKGHIPKTARGDQI